MYKNATAIWVYPSLVCITNLSVHAHSLTHPTFKPKWHNTNYSQNNVHKFSTLRWELDCDHSREF